MRRSNAIRAIAAALLIIVGLAGEVQGITVKGNRLYDGKGRLLKLKGINWFGFNNGQTVVDGLWAGKTSLTVDFSTVVYRMQLLGFNAVRLPFSFKDFNLPAKDYMYYCQVASYDSIRRSVTPPGVDPYRRPLPMPRMPLLAKNGQCNIGMPKNTYQRFLWAIKYFAQAGFKVVIDNHVFLEDPTAYQNPGEWARLWAQLAADVAKDPVMKEATMFDLVNEPDNRLIFWTHQKGLTQRPRLGDLYLSAMDAIHKVHPSAVFVLEGTGQVAYSIPSGDGFVTDKAVIKSLSKTRKCTPNYCLTGIEDPNFFFQALMKRPYAQNIVWGPHFYAQSIIPFRMTDQYFKAPGIYKRLSDSFGYLTKDGYCSGGKCLKWPVLIGEFAAPNLPGKTKLKGDTGVPDKQTTDALVAYLTSPVGGGRHDPQAIHWFYWCWNDNSPDTGGVVKSDWAAIDWRKVAFMQRIGLKPWYA